MNNVPSVGVSPEGPEVSPGPSGGAPAAVLKLRCGPVLLSFGPFRPVNPQLEPIEVSRMLLATLALFGSQ